MLLCQTESCTDDQLLDLSEDDSDKGDVLSDSSTHTIIPETVSDNDSNFNTDLLTRFAGLDQTPLAKDGDVESDKPETDERKSVKTVPVEAMTESPEIEMASKPFEVKDDKIIEKPEIPCGDEKFGLKDERFVIDTYRITMLMKGDFKRSNRVKSSRYYLPEIPLITPEGRKSGLLTGLRQVATFMPWAALYKWCFSEV